ncbi:MAG: solute carrier family 23 protein [Pseudomonadota bacterium]
MPPIWAAIPLGVQHVLAMFISNITPAIIVAGAAGLDAGEASTVYLIQMSMLFAGAATLLQTIGIGRMGARLPIVQGTSFAFLPIMIPIVDGKGPDALGLIAGGVIIGGLFHTSLSFAIGAVRVALPPLVTGLVVLMLGLLLMPVGVDYAAGGQAAQSAGTYGSLMNWAAALVVIIVTLSLKFFGRGLWDTASILIGLLAGYAFALVMGLVNTDAVAAVQWGALPQLFPFGITFDVGAVIGFCLMSVISAIESVGDVSGITRSGAGRDATLNELRGAILADGAGTAAAGLFGAFPNTSFSQNVGLIAMTGVMSRHVVTCGAVFLLLCGLMPKIGAAIATVPTAVLGGSVIIMFGMVASAGMAILSQVDWTQRTMTIFAVSLSVGLGFALRPEVLGAVPDALRVLLATGLLPATVIAVTLNLVLPESRTEA